MSQIELDLRSPPAGTCPMAPISIDSSSERPVSHRDGPRTSGAGSQQRLRWFSRTTYTSSRAWPSCVQNRKKLDASVLSTRGGIFSTDSGLEAKLRGQMRWHAIKASTKKAEEEEEKNPPAHTSSYWFRRDQPSHAAMTAQWAEWLPRQRKWRFAVQEAALDFRTLIELAFTDREKQQSRQ